MDFYHLSGGLLGKGSIIEPGNWGRIVRIHGWAHPSARHEAALEQARLARFPAKPSRLDAAYVCPTVEDARSFRSVTPGFGQHILYRVSLCDPNANSHTTDPRLCFPQGAFRYDWADAYCLDYDPAGASIPGINWPVATSGIQLREMLTLSQLRVEERLNT